MASQRSFLNALKWAYSANWGEKAFSSVFTFALAAMLGPRDFGVVSIALIYIAFIQMLLNQGLLAALVQKKNLEASHLDTVFWTNLAFSLSLAGISILLSGWWGRVNHLPELGFVISALSVCIPIEGLAIVQVAVLQRDMDFKSLALRTNASVVLGGVVGVVMALAGYGIWALVAQQIVKDILALLLLWVRSSWRPALEFSWVHLRDVLRFSFANFAAQLAIFFDGQSGAILMGALFGPVAVGLYRLAERLVNSVSAVTTSSIQSVSLPEFSRLQDKPEELRKSVLTCVRLSATATLPAMVGLAAVSHTLMTTLGPKWIPAASVLQILSVLGMFVMFSIFTGPLLQALSRPHYLAILEWTRTLASAGLLIVAAMFVRNADVEKQIAGIATARFITGAFLATPVFLFLLLRLGKVSIVQLLRAIAPSAMSAAAVGTSVWLFQRIPAMPINSQAILLVSNILLGGTVGIAVLLVLDNQLRIALGALVQRRTGFAEPSKELA